MMPFIYITGISETGKSAIRQELMKRGYVAYDIDEDHFRAWYNKDTDRRAEDQKEWKDTSIDWRRRYWLKVE
jgi:adenylylsulfate kinase-like enzyme